MIDIAEALTVFLNFLVAGAAVAGAVAAHMGLNRWKRQGIWEGDSKLAEDILVLLFRHKDALARVRNPAIWNHEIAEATEGEELSENPDQRRYQQDALVYQRRWDGVSSVRSELYPLLIKSDARWGPRVKELFSTIHGLETKLRIAVRSHLLARDPSSSRETKAIAQRKTREEDILYDWLEPDGAVEEDHFKQEYLEALSPLEDYLRDRLDRGGRHG